MTDHKETRMFECLLCKKKRSYEQLESLFNDGTPLCKLCGNEIRGSFIHGVEGKRVDYNEFKERTKESEE